MKRKPAISIIHPDPYPDDTVQEIIQKAHAAQLKYKPSLVGKKEICAYARRSWVTVMRWMDDDNFPVRKIDNVWESDTALIDEWKRTKIKPCQE